MNALRSETPVDATPLADVLANRSWRRNEWPFPHVTATEVFRRACYLDLVVAFEQALRAGSFRRDMPGFDATGLTFTPSLQPPLDLFVSRAWHDLMCGLFAVPGSGQMSGGLHHHEPGARPGGIHNDLNPGHFPHPPRADAIVVADRARCDYGSGRSDDPQLVPSRAVRAVAMIYYLANPAWEPGDGGETGLYRTSSAEVTRPAATVPPVNNSLVMFECTPFSFHAFARSCRQVRNSIVLWTHRPEADVVSRWGAGAVVPWT